jgi:hypothetical protein
METYYCALAITSKSIRAVLINDGKALDRFFINAGGTVALEEFSDFIFHNLRYAKHLTNVIFTGLGRGRRWKRLQNLLEERSGLFHLHIMHGPDIDSVLALDKLLRDAPAYHQLELIAYICSQRDAEPLASPSKVLMEWMLNRTRDQVLHLIDADRKPKQKRVPELKNDNYEQLCF